ncbi:2-phosphosulfolactate phosphatase [Bacillus canaveralius]|uniref:Probable 2-phosphosulfolactate phosphatase n=1 Tax=Bacillus canaveralius TaxID=1403243 RepID=A0A2N5GL96_9BACI|nr:MULTISPECIES: 2-phosphosulfolactate phosphatase [Bacillus]PLR82412.1 2-phosphosulfolactate phosphatase [Bacillus canaveralius]PLR85663.1 2-phosphosulfolactate phosphatase [Bacillus sp. V33-4]PLR95583.1 2-phosphosulfolactate phosphatase [Bacillus canaveralius]
MKITIHQGHQHQLEPSDINIVIDVIRAFTVAHYAFRGGVKEILLVKEVSQAVRLKEQYPNCLLAGEVGGLPIKGFDLDNSPRNVSTHNMFGKTIVQKTTNGVKATLNALEANDVFVTGFSNARSTAEYVKKLAAQIDDAVINIIASHPDGDDDLACAQYMKSIIEGVYSMKAEEVVKRIVNCRAAEKFFDESQPEFDHDDIYFCIKELPEEFVMRVDVGRGIPRILMVTL